jgi:methyl-accepting chemotaxis protein
MEQYINSTIIPARDTYLQQVNAFRDFEIQDSKDRSAAITKLAKTIRLVMIVVSAVAILIGLCAAWIFTTGITRPLGVALRVAETVASGDLTSKIESTSKDETGQLMQALARMNTALYDSVLRIRQSADAISTASSEIASGNQDLSSRTEEQASSLEETAASMEEITSTVRQNGDNARQANQLASQAADVATRGSEAAGQVANTMSDIADASNKIVDIISVIDGIAFQTNILALNAAVEAARAGEQGRGFAVVATEVRSLAQRSATAAREIKTLIDDSVHKVNSGSELVNNAVRTMLEIGESIRKVNDIMNEITMATQEQVQGIEQVNTAVTEMDTVSQQNAALVEEAAAAAESLQNQARELVEVVGIFRTGTGSGASAARLASSVRPAQHRPAPARRAAPARAVKAAARAPAPALAAPIEPSRGESDDWEEF